MKNLLIILLVLLCFYSSAQTEYQQPAPEIMALADVATPPQHQISRNNTYLLLLERPLYKTIEALAEPELKLGGLRINPKNFNVSRTSYYTSIKLQQIANGKNIQLTNMPQPLKAQHIQFSPNEKHCAFVQVEKSGLSLWMINIASGVAKQIVSNELNATMGAPYSWMGNDDAITFKSREKKQQLAQDVVLPKGPATQDATGVKAAARTYQDLLKNKQDEKIFYHYTASSIKKINTNTLEITTLLLEAVYVSFSPSPDNNYLLTEELTQPYSYTLPYYLFAADVKIYNSTGALLKLYYQRPLQDKTPISFDAVASGKREISWQNNKPATLFWAEALDGGDPSKKVDYRDELFVAEYPYTNASSLCKLKNRYSGVIWGNNNVAVVKDFWWKNRNTKTYLINPSLTNSEAVVIFDKSREDLYADPGDFQTTFNQYNKSVLLFNKDNSKLYLVGEGHSPEGNKPFIDEFDIATKNTKRLWRADGKTTYERIVRLTNIEQGGIITSIQSPKIYPNLYQRNILKNAKPTPLTFNINPYLSLQNISKQRIFYKRNDGTQLSATLYLPAGYNKQNDGRLPMLMDAYPTEYKDDKAAGQVQESPHQFISIGWYSPLFWVNRGYAVLEDAQFPIIGKGDTEPNDTYIEQLVADAQAAINAVDSMGVVDKNRCAVMGHSYGAFMTANLLAHSNLFAAGLARSGAYNRTLTPFGFQAEERSYWEAQQVYLKMSPFNYAHQIKSPLLIIHGDADNNPGTFTLQSERLFQAIKGNGGKSRLVLLPYESHSYAARENVLHMLWEMDMWLNEHVKNKK